MANLADILVTLTLDTSEFSDRLRSVGQDLNNFRNHVDQVTTNMNREFTQNLAGMSDSLQDIGNATQSTSTVVNQNTNSINDSLNSVSRSSRTLARTLGTSLRDQRRVLVAGGREFQNFGNAGRRVSQDIRDEFSALPRHLQRYVQRLREAGESTEHFARLNELYGERIIDSMRRSNDYMQNRTTQSQRLMNSFANDTNLSPLTNGFLRLGDSMENTAKRGSVLNIALQRIGNNTSLKNLQDQMRFISQGIMRARGALLVFAIAGGLAIWGMIELASAVDDRVAPAFENMKSSLVDAMMPFITTFATGMVAVMNFVSAIADMVAVFSEAHPTLFSMIMSIAMLTLVLGALLSPLAVTGIWAEGVAASFAALWAIIAPFVLGVLAVIGVAIALAVALVLLWMSIKRLWENSEAFRSAFINIWNSIKTAIIDNVVEPISKAWDRLVQAFSGLITKFTGGAGTMTNLWTFLGDKIAIVVNAIAGVVLPILNKAFEIFGQIVVAIIDGVIIAINWLGDMWVAHGDQITAVLSVIGSYVIMAFTSIKDFIMSIMPQVVSTVKSAFELIMTIIDFVMKYIAPVVVVAFGVIWNIIKFLMPLILQMVVATWNNIKDAITSAIAIVQGVIKLFSSILQGDWRGAWEAVKSIFSNAIKLVWNLIQLYFLGKLLAPLKGFASSGLGIVKGAWNGIKAVTTSILTGLKAFIIGIWNAIKSSLSGSFTGIWNLAKTTFTGLKNSVMSIFNALKGTVTTVWNGIKTAITKPIETAKNTVLGIIKAIVKAFASMKISMPSIKLPKVGITEGKKTLFGKEFSYPKFDVQWNAKGGVFNGASILGGGQGVGEAGAEAVLPIQHKRYMKPFASAVASHLDKGNANVDSGGNKYEIIFNEPVVIREDADIQKIVDEMERRKKISERAKGVFSF